ncbi:MAG: hypothetical protein AB1Z67_05535 [Candidatus Limnocylindrales bacterium]
MYFWMRDALAAALLAGASVGQRLLSPVFSDARLPSWLDRHLGWNRAYDEARAKRAERSYEEPPRGKDASTDW